MSLITIKQFQNQVYPVLFVALVAVSFGIAANTPVGTPSPLSLSPDWWAFYENITNHKTLETRIESTQDSLKQLTFTIDPISQIKLNPLIIKIISDFKRYQELSETPRPEKPPATLQTGRFTFEQTLGIASQQVKLQQQLDSESQELLQIGDNLKNAEKQQSRNKLAYFDLPPKTPNRLEMGLLLMQSRVELENIRLELKWHQIKQQDLQEAAHQVIKVFKLAGERLSAKPEDVNKWRNIEKKTDEAAKVLSVQLLRTQSEELTPLLDATPIDKARAQLARLNTFLIQTELAYQQVIHIRAKIAVGLLAPLAISKPQSTYNNSPLLEQSINNLADITAQMNKLQETVLTMASAVKGDKSTSQLSIIYKQQNQIIAKVNNNLHDLSTDTSITQSLTELLGKSTERNAGELGKGVRIAKEAAGDSWKTIHDFFTNSLFELNGTPVTILGILRVIFIIFVAWWISRLFRHGLTRLAQNRANFNSTALYTLSRISHYLILSIGFMVGLSSVGIDFTKFALFASALGVGVGFGLQTLIGNFVAGLIILFDRSLKIGDFVELQSGLAGVVSEINMRCTRVTSNDNFDILVPNSEFVNGQVKNWTHLETLRRLHVPFGVAYGTDKEKVKKAVLEAADEVPYTLNDPMNLHRNPDVWLVEFGDSSLNFELVVWLTKDAVMKPQAVRAAYLWAIETKLNQYNIEIPFPQRDMNLKSVLGSSDPAIFNRLKCKESQGYLQSG